MTWISQSLAQSGHNKYRHKPNWFWSTDGIANIHMKLKQIFLPFILVGIKKKKKHLCVIGHRMRHNCLNRKME